MTSRKHDRFGTTMAAVCVGFALALFAGCSCCAPAGPAAQTDVLVVGRPGPEQLTFPSAQAAADALVSAAKAQDHDAMHRIFGPQAVKDLVSGDKVEDNNAFNRFAARASEHMGLENKDANTAVLNIGKNNWPFPIPVVRTAAGQWFFDTAAGKQEILARRIGRNELETIKVCRSYVEAQREYAAADRDGSGVSKYAQRLVSTPGHKDGLFWEAGPNDEPSPFGPLAAQAAAEGYSHTHGPQPFHGYTYRILTRQGDAAPGGKYNYVINGNMIAGFGLIAFPAKYGQGGIMTFIVSHQGKVYQKDLGPDTAAKAAQLKEYNPDSSWTLVKD